MAFKPAYPDSVQTVTVAEATTAGTPAVGTLVRFVSGYLDKAATAGSVFDVSNQAFGVLAEVGHNDATQGTHDLKVYVITPDSVWIADTTDSPAQADLGIASQISSGLAKIKTATSDAGSEEAVLPFEIYRAASDKKVLCRFFAAAIQSSV